MAKSGIIQLSVTSAGDAISGWIEWSESSVDTSANTSKVTAKLVYRNSSGYGTYSDESTFYLTVNGTTVRKTNGYNLAAGGTYTVLTNTVTVAHNADGSKSITISGGGALTGTQGLSASSGSGTAALTTIPRATTPSVPSSADIGTQITISLPRASSSFTHNLWYKLGNGSYAAIATGVGTSCAWTIPMSLCSQITGALSGTLTISCDTYNGSTLIGGKQVTVKATVPTEVRPTVSAMTVEIVNDNTTLAQWGVAVKGYSKLRYAITGDVTGDYGATLSAYQFQANGETLTGQTGTTKVLATAGTMTAQGWVKDSRGRWSAVREQSITIYDYGMPIIKASHAYRCMSDGSAADDGTYLNVLCDGEIFDVGGHNAMTCRVRYRMAGGTWSSYTELTDNDAFVLEASLAVDHSYEVELSVIDTLGNSRVIVYQIPTAAVAFHLKRGGKAAAFGKYAEHANALELADAWDFWYKGKVLVDYIFPVGCIFLSAPSLNPGSLFGGTWEKVNENVRLLLGESGKINRAAINTKSEGVQYAFTGTGSTTSAAASGLAYGPSVTVWQRTA